MTADRVKQVSYVLIPLNHIRNMPYATCELNALHLVVIVLVNFYIVHSKLLKNYPLPLSKKHNSGHIRWSTVTVQKYDYQTYQFQIDILSSAWSGIGLGPRLVEIHVS